jgi:hypothetical protein
MTPAAIFPANGIDESSRVVLSVTAWPQCGADRFRWDQLAAGAATAVARHSALAATSLLVLGDAPGPFYS